MKKNTKKRIVLTIVMAIFFIMFILIQNSMADEWTTLEDKMKGIQKSEGVDSTKVSGVIKIVINLIRVAGAGIAVIMVTITGIKYMYSSPDDKADYKKKLIPMAIGAVLLVSATELIAKVGDVAMKL